MFTISMVVGEIQTYGIVTVERLPDGYFFFTWSNEKFDCTERVHPYNVTKYVNDINAGTH